MTAWTQIQKVNMKGLQMKIMIMFSKENIIMIPKTNYGNYEQYTSNTAISNFLTYLIGI